MVSKVALSRFPPTFDGNPWTYGWALFSLTLVSAICLTILIGWALEARHQREIDRQIDNWVPPPRSGPLTPFRLYRLTEIGFLLTILLGALPDVLIMLAWGEADEDTMFFLFALDRYCDGLLLIPFLATTLLLIWGGQVIDHRLSAEPQDMRLRPTWSFARQNLKMLAVVLLLAIGVTYAKAIA